MSRLEDLTKSLVDVYANRLDDQQRIELLEALDIIAYDAKYNVYGNTFPAEGPLSYDKYPKHMEFFAAGAEAAGVLV